MKVTRIKYIDLGDGKIKITGFENVATIEEIKAEFGKHVLDTYISVSHEAPYYYKDTCYKYPYIANSIFVRKNHNNGGLFAFGAGDIVPKDKFNHIISTMKQAAKRLIRIRKEVRKKPVEKVVEI